MEKLGYPISIYFYMESPNRVIYGIRGDGTYDVGAIAKHFGGGGHHDSAGWELTYTPGGETDDSGALPRRFDTLWT